MLILGLVSPFLDSGVRPVERAASGGQNFHFTSCDTRPRETPRMAAESLTEKPA